jgi:hypothetical protein
MITPKQLILLLPKAIAWVQGEESKIRKQGVPLDECEIAIAHDAGIPNAQHIRLLRVEKILLPIDSELRRAVVDLKLITDDTAGLTMRQGIFIRSREWREAWLVAHELKHTSQYLSLGIEEFLKTYASQCSDFGYENAPLELEAVAFGEKYRT